jgi:hypothetical protein
MVAGPLDRRRQAPMVPKRHPTPLSGGDRKALAKELPGPRDDDGAPTVGGAPRDPKVRRTRLRELERKDVADGGQIGPSPSIDQAVNGGYPRTGKTSRRLCGMRKLHDGRAHRCGRMAVQARSTTAPTRHGYCLWLVIAAIGSSARFHSLSCKVGFHVFRECYKHGWSRSLTGAVMRSNLPGGAGGLHG